MSISRETKTQNNSWCMANFLLFTCLALSLAGCVTQSSLRTAFTSQLTTEIGIMIELQYATDTTIFPMALPAEEINIRVYRDVDESLAAYETFDFDYTSKTNPLLEKELFRQLEKVLQAHGLTRVKKNPQIVISMDFFVGKKEQYTPPQTVTNTEMKYVWNTAMWGWNVGGYTSAVPVTSSTTQPGYTTTSYYSNIRLNFLNHAKLAGGEKLETPPLIWLGEADNEGAEPDIRRIAPVMFGELMGEFPDQSAKAPRRYVRCFRYGGLGIGFAPLDWRTISYVAPSSVAAEHGIKPGDVLVSINGESAGNWPSYQYWVTSSPWHYRSKDPYFQHVLSNRGDLDVELVIQSAETGKSATFRMRPRSEDRCLYVDQYGIPLQKTTGSPR
ncbi:MAG: hypothetical protein KKD92_06910 [Proteobacteria bacterium]|nr:hypothetical protein [Pseudomonadota bacterium]